MKKIVFLLLVLLFAIFLFLLIRETKVYFPYHLNAGFLLKKSNAVLNNQFYIACFFTHITTSFIVIVFGFIQFIPQIFIYSQRLHRFIGKAYAYCILLFSGTSGFVLALHANSGWIAKAGFICQSICWMATTMLAVKYAIEKNWQLHVRFMMMSYAFTLSAFTLRIQNTIVQNFWQVNGDVLYRTISWTSWIINVCICLVLFQINQDKKIILKLLKN